jgi:hypothetical protein
LQALSQEVHSAATANVGQDFTQTLRIPIRLYAFNAALSFVLVVNIELSVQRTLMENV